jgi:hypothetical protein
MSFKAGRLTRFSRHLLTWTLCAVELKSALLDILREDRQFRDEVRDVLLLARSDQSQ